MRKRITAFAVALATALSLVPVTGSVTAFAEDIGPAQMEYLDRGTVAVKTNDGVYLSWRLLGTEEYDTAFNVYRDGDKIATITDSTNYTDSYGTTESKYTVLPSGAEFTNSIKIDENDKRKVNAVTNRSGFKAIAASYDDGILENVCVQNLAIGAQSFITDFDVDKVFLWNDMTPVEGAAGMTKEEIIAESVSVWGSNALTIPIDKPAAMTLADGKTYEYTANDASVGDLDGDGDYEIILKWDCNGKDNSQEGYTGNVLIDAYDLEGNKLWRIDLGPNIRAGAHYTQLIVYDFDLDGGAEIAVKTAPGSKDSKGTFVNEVSLDANVKSGDNSKNYVGSGGFITSGPEYYSVFDGDGTVIDTVEYPFLRTSGNGNWGLASNGKPENTNRVDRFLGTVAYLDGVHPSIITWRGYYAKTTVAAYTLENGRLKLGNTFNAETDAMNSGQGNHNTTVGDVDGDGKDEIICGSIALDDDLSVLWNSCRGHGDALHLADYDPTHPGMEYFSVHESGWAYTKSNNKYYYSGDTFVTLPDGSKKEIDYGMTVYDAADGTELLHKGRDKSYTGDPDTGRGVMARVNDSGYYQCWGLGTYAGEGNDVFNETTVSGASTNFRIFWDGDTYDELLDGTGITSWNGHSMENIFTAKGCNSINSTKANPSIQADILGDWREEVVYPNSNSTALVLYTTTIPTNHKLYTLMHDRAYRMQVVGQNSAYNQPPHIGYYINESSDDPYDKRAYSAYVKTIHNGVTEQRQKNTEWVYEAVKVQINFVDAQGNHIKPSKTVYSKINTVYVAPDSYIEDIGPDIEGITWRFVGENSVDTGSVVDATVNLDLLFEAEQTHMPYSVNAVADGEIIKTLYSDIVKIGEETEITRYGDYGIVGDDGKYYVLEDTSSNSVTFIPSADTPAVIRYKEVSGQGEALDFDNRNVSAFKNKRTMTISAADSSESVFDESINGSSMAKIVSTNGNTGKYSEAYWDLSKYSGYSNITVSYDAYITSSGRMTINLLNAPSTEYSSAGWLRIGVAGDKKFEINGGSANECMNTWIRGTYSVNLITGSINYTITNRSTGEVIRDNNTRANLGLSAVNSLSLISWTANTPVYIDNISVVAYD